MISREKLLSEFNLNSVKETENANQLIRSFLKFSGFNMETEKIPSQLLKPLRLALNYWLNLIKNENGEYRNNQMNWVFHSILYDAILNKNPINYICMLCPSYKKGVGAIGFKDEPGQTTYVMFNNLKKINENTTKLGIPSNVRSFFYDIAIENARKLSNKEWITLERNIICDKVIAKMLNIPYNVVSKEFPVLFEKIGRYGRIMSKKKLFQEVSLNKEILEKVIEKSKEFYSEVFGWTIKESEKRALSLAHAYTLESSIIRKHFKNPIIVYSAYSYEKAMLYSGKDFSARIGIIYPKRPIGDSLSATISTWNIKTKR